MIRAGLWAAIGAAVIVALATLALLAEPPAPRPPIMRLSRAPVHEPPLPVFLFLAPEKDRSCSHAC